MDIPRKESILTLGSKVEIAKIIIKEALNKYTRPTIVWSGGKDSTVVLNLIKEVVEENSMKLPPALFIDHGDHYPETLKLLDEVSGAWNFKVISAKNEDLLNNVENDTIRVDNLNYANKSELSRIGFTGDSFEYSLESEVGNHLLKTVAMNSTIERYGFDALFTGVRWDENPARSNEVFISPRLKPKHVRIQPILPFLEKNIWEYIFMNSLPIHPMYKLGYRSIDGIHDSKKISDVPAWEQDMEATSERAGRSQDKEGMMERLRQNGYM